MQIRIQSSSPPNAPNPQIRNPIFEIRNKSEYQKKKPQKRPISTRHFVSDSDFELVSDFGFQCSDFFSAVGTGACLKEPIPPSRSSRGCAACRYRSRAKARYGT